MQIKPSLPRGTRDFSPTEVYRRNYLINTIKRQFDLFGFMPIETPSFENLETLLGKYGEEGDRLVFKILNSGDFLSKVDPITYSSMNSATLGPKIADKALRYDLTVPFARYAAMHRNDLVLPFKRYQIQPVWRADRPQKGRYREFYQCDADVVGNTSLWSEIEFIQLYDAVFHELGLKGCTIKINNRKLLSGVVEAIGAKKFLVPFTSALDKLDKVGPEKVMAEMIDRGIMKSSVDQFAPFLKESSLGVEFLERLKHMVKGTELGTQGIEEMAAILFRVNELDLKACEVEFDFTLARGLNYYTGSIFEVKAPEGINYGSIGGGGRYDDLTGMFGMKDLGGIGISFGLDRIYLTLEALGLFPDEVGNSLDVLCLNFGDNEARHIIKLVQELRSRGIKTEMFPTKTKMSKQMNYANARKVPYVIFLGASELEKGVFIVKDMASGKQKEYPLEKAAEFSPVQEL